MPAALEYSSQLLSRASTPPEAEGWLHEAKAVASLRWMPGRSLRHAFRRSVSVI